MFERFTKPAREAVVLAQHDARARRHGFIGTEHLLMGMLIVPDSLAAEVLAELGVTRAEVDAAITGLPDDGRGLTDRDAHALAAIGIDLDEVRRQVEDAFGPGALDRGVQRRRGSRNHLPFSRPAKKVLELSLRQALNLCDNYIGTEHLLLGLLTATETRGSELLAARGVTLATAKAAIKVARNQGAAGA